MDGTSEETSPMPPMVFVCAERGYHQWPNDDPHPFGYGDIVAYRCATCEQWVTV